MLTIWGRTNSSNVMKVLWLCHELQLGYRREDAGGVFGRTRDAAYRAINPNSLIPTIEDDGFVLWESNAILRYLARTRPGGIALYPEEPRGRGLVDQWLDWQLGTLTPQMATIFYTFIRLPEPERDLVAAAKARDEAERLWRILDARLAGEEYVAGAFSLADIALGPFVHRWYALPVQRPELPNLAAWYARLRQREGFRTHCDQPLT
ncbi:glutathione S-transferase family protein [Roseomonas sp. OT10]|uniref:glutathione S-transferase family protein n=1 Tax=Roseomonas cutis TaxID=2897332 RepID=UPI001E5D5008|nr:glutathione S-transferase family protein [Roseomonas sp. OT10]UFN50158.1 glutathione S-transferase family protein [Roseomonas sp. OT10]